MAPKPQKMTRLSRKQHYVPQFYLKRFSQHEGNTFKIFVLDKKRKTIFKTNITKVGYENWFYEINEKDNLVEKLLCESEKVHSKLLTSISKKFFISNVKEKIEIAEYLFLMKERTRVSRNKYLESVERNLDASARKNYDALFSTCGKPEDALEDIRKILQTNTMFGIDNKELNFFPESKNTIESIKNGDMFILSIKTKNQFITGDHPFSQVNLKNDGIQLLHPISPKLIVMVCKNGWFNDFANNFDGVSEIFIQNANEEITKNSKRFIFSNNCDIINAILIDEI